MKTSRPFLDAPTADIPVHQFIGGGPKPEEATFTIIDAALVKGKALIQIKITNLQGDVWYKHDFT